MNEKRAALYRIVHRDTGADYVGVSTRLKARWSDHRCEARRGSGTRFHRALAKHGPEAFDWKVIAWARSLKAALALERAARFLGLGSLNLTLGGDGNLGYVPSAETRRKVGEASRNRVWTAGARARLSAARRLHRHTPESRAKIGKGQKARTIERLREHLGQGLTQTEIGERIGISHVRVGQLMREIGVRPRGQTSGSDGGDF